MFNIQEIEHKNEDFSQSSLAVIINNQDKILILKRPMDLKIEHHPGKWCLAGGGSVKGETPLQTVLREVLEETGIKVQPSDMHYLFNKKENNKNYYFFHCYSNEEPKIMNVLDEHEEYKWIRADEIDNYDMIKDTSEIIKMAIRKTI